MGDFYTEQLIKKQTTMKDTLIKALLIAVAVASVFIVLIYPIGLFVPIIVVALVTFLVRRLDVEYEYLYVNGDLDIDKIMHQERRKKVFSANVSSMELLAPEGAPELNQFKNAKELDFTSGIPDARRYVFVSSENGQVTRMVFEPDDTIIEGLFLLAPRKVIRQK